MSNLRGVRRSLQNIVTLGLIGILGACGSSDDGDGNNKSIIDIGLINIELTDSVGLDDNIFQLLVDGKTQTNASISCTTTHPFASILVCTNAAYDANTNILTVSISNNGNLGAIEINFSNSTTTMPVTLTGDIGTGSGGARLVAKEFVARTELRTDNSVSTIFVLLNPEPGFDSGIISGDGLTTDITLWNGNYGAVYSSFNLSNLTDGQPQKIVALVSATSGAPQLVSGTYTLTLTNMSGSTPLNLNYSAPDPTTLFVANGLPPMRSEITINGAALNTADSASTAITVADGPYVLNWSNQIASPTAARWRVRFTKVMVDTNSTPIAHKQIRTRRIAHGGTGGPVYDGVNDSWSWTLPSDLAFDAGDTVRVEMRVSDQANTIRGRSQPFYITK